MKAGRAFAFVGAALLAIGVALVVLLPRGEPFVDDAAAARAIAGAKVAAASGGEGADGRGEDDRAQRTTAAAGAAEAAGGEAVETVALDVRVEWPDGRAAADAELWFLPPRTRDQAIEDEAEFERVADDEVVLRARGRKAPLDAEGRARVTACAEGALCARRGEHFASVRLQLVDTSGPVRLVLQRDVLLQVEVVDAQGAARSGVALAIETSFVQRALGHQDTDFVELPPTDVRGLTRIVHLQQQVATPAAEVLDWSCKLVARHRVAALPERVVTADELLHGAPIRCVVAAGGAVEVTVVDDDGRQLRDRVQLVDVDTQFRFWPADHGAEVSRFHDVPLGKRWRIEVWRDGDVWHQLELVGPGRIGEILAVPVVVPFRRVMLGLLVVCEDGEVARGAMATVLGQIEGGSRTGSSLHSTQATVSGRAKWICQLWLGRGERLTRAVVRLQHPSLTAVHDVPLPDDVTDDADLGRFVVPLPRAREELLRIRVRLAGAVVTRTASLHLDARQHGDWSSGVHESTLDGDYRVLRGLRPLDGFRLVCGHDGARLATRYVGVGETVDVELEPAARLFVPLRLRHVPANVFEAKMIFGNQIEDGPLFDDKLVWSQLPLGVGTLSLRVDGREVLRRELPPLVAGRNVWPSWDEPIDLDRLARVVRVRATDGIGAALDSWSRFLVPRGATTLPAAWPKCQEPGWLLVDDAARDLVVWGQQRVPVRLPQPGQDLDVVLQSTTKLVVREAAGSVVEFAVAVTKPGLADPLLHAVLESLADRSGRYQLAEGSSEAFDLAPGTELSLRVHRGDSAPQDQKVVVGASSPQEVLLR